MGAAFLVHSLEVCQHIIPFTRFGLMPLGAFFALVLLVAFGLKERAI
jgi:hypothetical protein